MKNGTISKKPGFSKSSDRKTRPSFGRSSERFGDKPIRRKKDFSGSDEKKTLYKITCAQCGNVDTVPFRPISNKPVLCRDCFGKDGRQEARGSDSRQRPLGRDFDRGEDRSRQRPRRDFDRPDTNTKQMEELHKKLDKILALLEAE